MSNFKGAQAMSQGGNTGRSHGLSTGQSSSSANLVQS